MVYAQYLRASSFLNTKRRNLELRSRINTIYYSQSELYLSHYGALFLRKPIDQSENSISFYIPVYKIMRYQLMLYLKYVFIINKNMFLITPDNHPVYIFEVIDLRIRNIC